jgi:branched-chain amino acid transport system permease protein
MVASFQAWREGLPPAVRITLRYALFLFGLLVVILFPLQVSQAGDTMNTATLALAYVVMALGLNIVVGFAGLLDLGYLAFYAIGAYCVGWFGSSFYSQNNFHFLATKFANVLPGIHLWWPIIVLIAIVLCAIAGVLIGLPTLRLRGDYIAIVTLGFGEIIRVFALNGDAIHIFGHQLTNGRQGITATDAIGFPGHQGFSQLDLRPWYWVALGMVLITLYVNFRVRDSRLGRAWIAIREDEVAASSMGVPLVRTKLMAYATGAALGGMAGAFLGSYLTNVTSDSFQFSFSILILAMVILGGLGSIWGVVLGAIALTYINYELLPNQLNNLPGKFGLGFQLTDVQIAIYGALLVIIMVLRPQGLIPERRHKMELAEGIGAGDAMAAEGIIEEPM